MMYHILYEKLQASEQRDSEGMGKPATQGEGPQTIFLITTRIACVPRARKVCATSSFESAELLKIQLWFVVEALEPIAI
jgi:hypothetical protein